MPTNPALPDSPNNTPQIVIQQQSTALGRYGKFILLLLGLALMSIVGLVNNYQSYFNLPNVPQEKFHSLEAKAKEKIAIVEISGTIMNGNGFVKKQLDRVRKDDDVVAVVLRIDSPGGTVTGSDYLYHHVRKLCSDRELPLVVSMGSICASGGYYIAMAVGDQQETIFAEPTTWTGSIGVVIPHYDFSGLLASYNIEDDSIASHKHKLMGSPTRKRSEEERRAERELFQELVDTSFARFKKIVLSGRPKLGQNNETLAKATTGQIFTADQALELGLVDKIGFIEDAIKRAAELANRDTKKLRCIRYEEPPPSLGTLLQVRSNAPSPIEANLRELLARTTPRAYYLSTLLPPVLSNSKP